jgi:hypothetical protein
VGPGSGCSKYETKPTWQLDSGCSKRTVADVSAIADPATGVAVYDSTGSGGWAVYGGTSVSSPLIAGIYGLAGVAGASDIPASYAYASPQALNDVTIGKTSSSCTSYLCEAVVGYDGPTGLGTPNGILAFQPAQPAVSLSSTSLSFGSQGVGTASASQTVTLTNSGGETLTISSIAVTGANASSFVFGNSCGTSLAAGANCTIHGHFAPTKGGALTAAITIADNAGDSPQTIALTGTGASASTVSFSPASLAFGAVQVGQTSASLSVTVTNTGTLSVTFSSIAVTGPGAAAYAFSSPGCTTLAAGASCLIHGHFSPTAAGSFPATITVTDNAMNSPQSIAVSGSGTGQTTLSFSPSSLTFAAQAVGTSSASQTVTITNTGSIEVDLDSISVTGSGASSFAFTDTGCRPLAAGASCTVHGHFTPQVQGPITAAITVANPFIVGSPQSVALSGTGIGPGSLSFSSTSLTFASQKVGTSSASQTVTVSNTGSSPVTFSSIAVTGQGASSFVFANTGCTTLAPMATCTIHGHFSPTATGPISAAITVTDNATGSPQSIALSGTGQ